MSRYYLAPKSWNFESYREVYDEDEIANLPNDWGADSGDCDLIGDFDDRDDAIAVAKRNPDWASDMKK